MSVPDLRKNTQPCIWMTAGLVAYKLCERDFDCEHCPLDAALRGEAPEPSRGARPAETPHGAFVFPPDRLYTNGHVWVQRVGRGGTRYRVGLDMFASALIGAAEGLLAEPQGTYVQRGERLCEIRVRNGTLPVIAPLTGIIEQTNPAANTSAAVIESSPYEAGWLVEMQSERSEELAALCAAEVARDHAGLDLRRFGRLAAVGLFSGSSEVGATLPDGGEPLTDLRSMLGNTRFLQLLREFVH